VRPQDPELARLLATAVVPVRLTSIKGVDLSLFDFDTDQTMMAFLIDPGGTVHFRWTASDNDPGAISGLRALLQRRWKSGRPAPISSPRTLADNAGFRNSKRFVEACWHCHYASDAEVADLRRLGNFDKSSLFRYPPPTTIGIEMEGPGTNRIKSVAPGSAAARAGLASGDEIAELQGRAIHTLADFRFALDRIRKKQTLLDVVVRRGNKRLRRRIPLEGNWRSYDISDRPSQGSVPPILGIWEERLPVEQRRKLGLAEDRMALEVTFLFPGARWEATRGDLRLGDILLGVDGVPLPDLNARQFHTWLRLNRDVGDRIRFDVLRRGKRIQVEVIGSDPGFEG